MVTKLHSVTPVAFSYGDLPEEDRDAVRLHAIKIKLYGTMTVSAAAAIGLQLLEAKGRLPHGKFGPWLTHEFDWSQTTANRYIQVAHFVREHGSPSTDGTSDTAGSEDLDNFDLSAIYRLVDLHVPTDLRDFALDMVKDGQRVARRHLDAELARLRPAAVPAGRDRRPLTDTRAAPSPSADRQTSPDRGGDPQDRPADGTSPPVPGWSWPSLHVMPGDESSAETFARRIAPAERARARKLADAWAEWLDSVVVHLDEMAAETPARGPRAVA